MKKDGNALVYCQGAFNTPNGKTAHGLVRFTERYDVVAVVDSTYAGRDAGEVLDNKAKGIPVVATLAEGMASGLARERPLTHFVVGLAPDGGRLDAVSRADVAAALELGLHVDSGLHDFLSEDAALRDLAAAKGLTIRDIRKPPPLRDLHFFTGKIERVDSLKVALLGTDSAVGKRTTAWLLVHALQARGIAAELAGTGQTAWMQGARYSMVMDSIISDFVAGEIEHAVWSAWSEGGARVIVIEGQGSLMNPAYPGGFELLAAGRPDVIVLQHAPARVEYDGFPGYPIHPLGRQIQALELISGKPVVAITINHEDLADDEIPGVCRAVGMASGLATFDVLRDGAAPLADLLCARFPHILGDGRGVSS